MLYKLHTEPEPCTRCTNHTHRPETMVCKLNKTGTIARCSASELPELPGSPVQEKPALTNRTKAGDNALQIAQKQ